METKKLHELCLSITDCPHSTPKWTATGKLVIRNQYIKNGKLDLSNPSYTDEQTFHLRCRRAKPIAGDLIITREAPMGEVCMVPQDLDCCLGQRMVLLKVNKDLCSNLFLLYSLMSRPVQHQILWSEGTGTTVSNLRIPHLENLDIPYIPLSEQYLIAETLSSLDNKIELNNRINKNLEAQAQAIFKSWFIDFEPFQDGEFVESELGQIPKGWRAGKLSELVEIKYGKDHKKLADGVIPVYGSGGIMRFADRALCESESVLVPRKGTLNNVIYINIPFWTVDTMFYTNMKFSGAAKMVYFFLKSKDLASMNAGTAVPSMTTDILNNIPLVIAPATIIKQYDALQKPLFEQMETLKKQNQTLSTLRDTLLPKLMSGEIQIPQEV